MYEGVRVWDVDSVRCDVVRCVRCVKFEGVRCEGVGRMTVRGV